MTPTPCTTCEHISSLCLPFTGTGVSLLTVGLFVVFHAHRIELFTTWEMHSTNSIITTTFLGSVRQQESIFNLALIICSLLTIFSQEWDEAQH